MPTSAYRLKDGRRVPGVTTILSRFKDSKGLMYWAFQQGQNGASELYEKRDEAATVGSYVHDLVYSDLHALTTPIPPKDLTADQLQQAQTGFDGYLRWKHHCNLRVSGLETPMVSEEHKYGGTPDGIGEDDVGLCMLDWKSSSGFYYDYLIQVVAYIKLYMEVHPGEEFTGGVHIVRFGKVGGEFAHYHFPVTHPAMAKAWDLFRLYREAYDLDAYLKKTVR